MSKRSDFKAKSIRAGRNEASSFKCLHCHHQISANPHLAGVQNRNHCPYCLWSRHVDWKKAGDRLAACKAGMQPVGLTMKATRKKYGPANQGELMLIHVCEGCGKVSINRIAADDNPEVILEVFESSFKLDARIARQLELDGITALQPADREQVETQLFGKRPILSEE